jgi:tRNA G18 (ribose-2'-O)-methylase SpoU
MAVIRPGMGADVAVALDNPKYPHNVGAAVRAASCFGVKQVWMSGRRVSLVGAGKGYRLPREERMRGYKDVELLHGDYFLDAFDRGITPVAVELRPGAESLLTFEHPERAVYVFGPEDGSLSPSLVPLCHRFVVIPMRHCANLSSAVYTVLYDRHAKRVAAGLEDPHTVTDERGFEEPDHMADEVGVR